MSLAIVDRNDVQSLFRGKSVDEGVMSGRKMTNNAFRSSYLPPGSYTIAEEFVDEEGEGEEEEARTKPLGDPYKHYSLRGRKTAWGRSERSSAMLRPEPQDRRVSNLSGSSVRSYSQDALSTPTLAMIAQEREDNLRTPRPHSASAVTGKAGVTPLSTFEEKEASLQQGSSNASRILQWQQRRDASDATAGATYESAGQHAPAATERSYPSDSLGRVSVASSAFTGGSEFGHGLRAGSEAGHEWAVSSGTAGSAARKAKKVAPPELLVVVRPPPSKQGNPLNLQIQLVTPQAGGSAAPVSAGGRVSGEISRDDVGQLSGSSMSTYPSTHLISPPAQGALRRSNSVSSARSAVSESSSAGFSTTSASSTGRRVTPLYNLCFHSLTPTTVTDAGTDQKVARFSKKGVDIDGFGLVVPHELILGVNDLASIERRRRSSTALSGIANSVVSGDRASTDFTAASTSQPRSLGATSGSGDSGSGVQPPDETTEPPTSFDAMSPKAKEDPVDVIGGLGGKLMRGFKRFSMNAAASSAPSTGKSEGGVAPSVHSSTTLDSGAPTSILARMRGVASKGRDAESVREEERGSMTARESILNGEVEGEIPQLVVGAGLRSDGSRRAQGYYWTVRRWNRRIGEEDEDSEHHIPGRNEHGVNPILNSVWKRFNMNNRMGGIEQHPPSHSIPVRFEWTRAAMRKRSVNTSGTTSSVAVRASNHGRAATDLGMLSTSPSQAGFAGGQTSLRTSLDARSAGHESVNSHGHIDQDGAGAANGSGSALQLPRAKSGSRPSSVYSAGGGDKNSPNRGSLDRNSAVSGGDAGEVSDPEDSETKWTCHLVLGPSTRIPIGSLSPTPHHPKLVAQLTVPYPLPDLSQSGLGADGAGLTREELKDIISVTSLFVIVREGFGGLAKRRKGDSALKFGAAVAQR